MIFTVDCDGYVTSGHNRWRCALGRGGIGHKICEGDGITPLGRHVMGRVFWRADRILQPQTGLECIKITKNMGWCDDPSHADYNQLIVLPHLGHYEELWRKDHVYDVVIELLYNTDPVQLGQGSAIFMHVAHSSYSATEGCIALKLNDIFNILKQATPLSMLNVDQR